MFKNNDKISLGQSMHILILTLVGVGILTLPSELTEDIGPDGFFPLLIGGVFVIIVAYIIGYIIKSFPGKGLFEILTICFTKPMAYIILFMFLIYSLLINAFIVRVFGEVIKMFLLIQTPIEVVIFSMLIITAYLARNGIEPLGRIAELIFPLIFIPAIILFVLAWVDAEYINYLPVFQASPMEIIRAVPIGFFAFAGFEFFLIFGRFINKPEKTPKYMVIGILIVLVFYIIILAVTLGVFGEHQLVHLVWPTLTLFKVIQFPGLFIENVEALVMVSWIFVVFMSIAPIHLAKTVLIGDLFNLKERDFFALPLIPIIYLTALTPQSVAETYDYMGTFSNYAIPFFGIAIPILLFISTVMKKSRKKEGGGSD